MIFPAVNVNGIHLSSQQHEALVSIWRTGRMPEPHAGQKPWLWIQALRLTDKGRHIVQLLQDRKAVPYQSTADNPHYGAYWDAYYSNQSTYRYQPGLEIICKRNCDET